jgi:hypothetical protein
MLSNPSMINRISATLEAPRTLGSAAAATVPLTGRSLASKCSPTGSLMMIGCNQIQVGIWDSAGLLAYVKPALAG